MAEEINEAVQIIELLGRGVGGAFRGIAGAYRFANWADAKNVQLKAKLMYASTGKHKTLKVSEMLKLTNNTGIVSLNTEDESVLVKVYDDLKRARCNFAELPDLSVGDGWTQIMIDNAESDRVRFVLQKWEKEMPSKSMSMEEYELSGGALGVEQLNEMALDGYTRESHKNSLQAIQAKLQDPQYRAITLNIATMLDEEYKDRYVVCIPGTYGTYNEGYTKFEILKEDCLLLDQKKSILTCMPVDGSIRLLDGNRMDAGVFHKHFNPFSDEHKAQVMAFTTDLDVFPSFEEGQSELASALNVEQFRQDLEDLKKGTVVITADQKIRETGLTMDFKMSDGREFRASRKELYQNPEGQYLINLDKEAPVTLQRTVAGEGGKELQVLDTLSYEDFVQLHRELSQEERTKLRDSLAQAPKPAIAPKTPTAKSQDVVDKLVKYQQMAENKENGYMPFLFEQKSVVAEGETTYRVALPAAAEDIGTPTVQVPKSEVLEYDKGQYVALFDGEKTAQIEHIGRDGHILSSRQIKNYEVCTARRSVERSSEMLALAIGKMKRAENVPALHRSR